MKGSEDMNELKPCPFCGGKVKKAKNPLTRAILFICDHCGADVCFYEAEHDSKATEAWNKRISYDYEGFTECK